MSISMRQMLEAGVHFGHQTRYWNPKMSPYIFGFRNKIHIINLEKSLEMFNESLEYIKKLSANQGTIVIIGTKRQARSIVEEESERAKTPYVNHRWLGGMLTNFGTVRKSIKVLKEMEESEGELSEEGYTKKELLTHERKKNKLLKSFGGIKNMDALPDALFVIDVGHQKIAVEEANKLGIPVVGVVDTNNSPEGIDYVIPGNDDSRSAIKLYVSCVCDAIMEGKKTALDKITEQEFVEEINESENSNQTSTENKEN